MPRRASPPQRPLKKKKKFRIGLEVTYRHTDYKNPSNLSNQGLGIHPQFQWTF